VRAVGISGFLQWRRYETRPNFSKFFQKSYKTGCRAEYGQDSAASSSTSIIVWMNSSTQLPKPAAIGSNQFHRILPAHAGRLGSLKLIAPPRCRVAHASPFDCRTRTVGSGARVSSPEGTGLGARAVAARQVAHLILVPNTSRAGGRAHWRRVISIGYRCRYLSSLSYQVALNVQNVLLDPNFMAHC
jgi:hypothetical protein